MRFFNGCLEPHFSNSTAITTINTNIPTQKNHSKVIIILRESASALIAPLQRRRTEIKNNHFYCCYYTKYMHHTQPVQLTKREEGRKREAARNGWQPRELPFRGFWVSMLALFRACHCLLPHLLWFESKISPTGYLGGPLGGRA